MKLWYALFFLFYSVIVKATPIQITDSHGKQNFTSPPQRVVVINWTLTEQLLELGITPIAVADIAGYHERITKPTIPSKVIDVGLRAAPDLRKIKSLRPDLILIGYSQRPLARALSNIAPVVYFNNFSRRYDNAAKSRERFLELAKLFDKVAFAEQRLEAMDTRIAELKNQLAKYHTGSLPKVTFAVIDDDKQAWMFLSNSMPYYALQELGIELVVDKPPSKFGVHRTKSKDMAALEGCILFISYTNYAANQSRAWLGSKAAQNGCFFRLPAVSLYGGAISIQYLVEAIAGSLMKDFSSN